MSGASCLITFLLMVPNHFHVNLASGMRIFSQIQTAILAVFLYFLSRILKDHVCYLYTDFYLRVIGLVLKWTICTDLTLFSEIIRISNVSQPLSLWSKLQHPNLLKILNESDTR